MKYLKYFESDSEEPLYPEDYFNSVFDSAEIKFSRFYGINQFSQDRSYVIDIKFFS